VRVFGEQFEMGMGRRAAARQKESVRPRQRSVVNEAVVQTVVEPEVLRHPTGAPGLEAETFFPTPAR